jgi:hypothetical protein
MELVQARCKCGHSAVISLSRFVHRDLLLPRLRCSVCGARAAYLMGYVGHYQPGPIGEAEAARCAALPVIDADKLFGKT